MCFSFTKIVYLLGTKSIKFQSKIEKKKLSRKFAFGSYVSVFDIRRVRVPPRQGAVKIELKGIFVGAKVVRGPDWEWGTQDGGQGNLYLLVHS